MPTYTVIQYERSKPWEGKFGPMLDHVITVRDEMEQTHASVTLAQKPDTPAPTVGQEIVGTLEQGQWGKKLKKAQEFAQKGGGGWKPRDPAETAAIQRQHSQGLAVRAAVAAGWFQDFDPEDDAGKAKLALLSRLATWFQRDIAKGVRIATEDAQTAQSYGQRREPTPTGTSDVPGEAPQHPSGGSSDDLPWTPEAA